MAAKTPKKPFRSQSWFNDTHRLDQTAIYLERYTNNAFTLEELRSGKPIVGIAQTGRRDYDQERRSGVARFPVWDGQEIP